MIAVTLPIEPRGQGRARAFARGGHAGVYESGPDAKWKSDAITLLRLLWPSGIIIPSDVALSVGVYAVFSRPRRLLRRRDPDGAILHAQKPDADNVAKIVLDALCLGGYLDDDARVSDLAIAKRWAAKGARGEVEVRIDWPLFAALTPPTA